MFVEEITEKMPQKTCFYKINRNFLPFRHYPTINVYKRLKILYFEHTKEK